MYSCQIDQSNHINIQQYLIRTMNDDMNIEMSAKEEKNGKNKICLSALNPSSDKCQNTFSWPSV